MAHCKACDLELEPGEDRCPRCLRKSTVVGAEDDGGSAELGAPSPSWAGPRAIVALAAIALGGLVAWQAFVHETWLEARHVWVAAIIASLGLVTMPLRVAFRMPTQAASAAEALRSCALATLAVDGLIVLFAAVTALSCLALGDSVVAVPVGLFAFFMLLVAAPVVVAAVRRPRELGETMRRSGKQAALLAGVVVVGTALVYVHAAAAPEEKTIVIADPKALDPMDLEHVAVERRTTTSADGTTSRHLRADGGDVERTLLALDAAAVAAVQASKADRSSNGLVQCRVPERLRTPENAAALAREQASMNETLAKIDAKTPSGRAVHVVFEFGDALD